MLWSRILAVRGRWLRPLRAPVIGILLLTSLHADSAAVTAFISCPVVPPGGTAQITVMLPSPLALTHGRFQIDVDPSVFGDISAIHVFSASGDQQGVARLQGRHADVVFSANSGVISLAASRRSSQPASACRNPSARMGCNSNATRDAIIPAPLDRF